MRILFLIVFMIAASTANAAATLPTLPQATVDTTYSYQDGSANTSAESTVRFAVDPVAKRRHRH